MYWKTGALLLASFMALAIAGTGPVFAEAENPHTVAQQITDARQEAQILTTYALSPYLRANALEVSVHAGRATLTGNVEDGVHKDLAEQIALGVGGIKKVYNDIAIQADFEPPARTTERSFGERVEDATVTAKVKSKLMWSTYTNGLSTNVDTLMGKVTLTGSADTAAAKELAGSLAGNTSGVVAVDNQLTIKALTEGAESGEALAKADHPVSDAWISAKVKATFMYSSNVNSSDISVSTSAGVVTLSGKVDSPVERDLAIALAKNIRGVNSVESEGLII